MPLEFHHREAIARELKTLASEIELLGADLCCDAQLVAAHGVVLQAFDSICQRQVALAQLIVADDLQTALNDCRLDRIAALFQ